jgi:hypothetical protein
MHHIAALAVCADGHALTRSKLPGQAPAETKVVVAKCSAETETT